MSIYFIRNKINGKVYVGKTVQSVEVRWQQHQQAANRGCGWALSSEAAHAVAEAELLKSQMSGMSFATLGEKSKFIGVLYE